MGSSTVMMCSVRWLLMKSIMAARVVDFPEPVAPVTSTRPRGSMAIFLITGGRLSSSRSGQLKGMTRNTMLAEPRWEKMLTRKRPMPGTP
jgi:hypothetical protein